MRFLTQYLSRYQDHTYLVLLLVLTTYVTSQLWVPGVLISVDTFEYLNTKLTLLKLGKLTDLTWNMGTLDPENVRLTLYHLSLIHI